jgi:hypothetical protein
MNAFVKGLRNKRSGNDRRSEEKGPPIGWRERRRTVERRKPEVQEISLSEWAAFARAKACEVE